MVWTSTASQRKGSSDAVARQTHDCQMLQLFSSYPNMVSSDCDPYVWLFSLEKARRYKIYVSGTKIFTPMLTRINSVVASSTGATRLMTDRKVTFRASSSKL